MLDLRPVPLALWSEGETTRRTCDGEEASTSLILSVLLCEDDDCGRDDDGTGNVCEARRTENRKSQRRMTISRVGDFVIPARRASEEPIERMDTSLVGGDEEAMNERDLRWRVSDTGFSSRVVLFGESN